MSLISRKKPTVQILMATYNGEKNLREQLDSIINQTYDNWILMIRDDGSTDGTIELLEEYCKKDKRIIYEMNDSNEHGWQINFQKLMQKAIDSPAEQFMFCDQDDIWEKNKIERFFCEITNLEEINPQKPIVVYGNMMIINGNNEIINPDFNQIYNMEVKSITDVFYTQRVYGCNMIFNKVLLEYVYKVLDGKVYSNLSHDGLVVKVAAAKDGIIKFMKETFMRYRRDGNNATANQEFSVTRRRVINRLKNFDQLASDQSSTYRQSIHVIDLIEKNNEMLINEGRKLKEIEKSIKKGGIYAGYIWLKYRVNCGNKQRTISHFLVLLSGKHKKYLGEFK